MRKAIAKLSHPRDPIIHDNTPACGGIIIYLGGLVGGLEEAKRGAHGVGVVNTME